MTDTPTRSKTQTGDSWSEIAKTIVYAGLIAIVIRTFFFQPFNIPTGSMEDTLKIGDYLFVEKFAYGYSRYSFPFGGWPFGDALHGRLPGVAPSRGDVVVFKFPQDNSTDFIKRVIGLPGDRIQMIDDILYLNGQPVKRERVADFVGDISVGSTPTFGHWARYRETLPGGKSYYTIDQTTSGSLDNTQVFVVPAGHYFMMGDNRDDSDDSRADVGYVPAENLEGKALFRFFSVDGSARWWEIWKWPFAIRYSRILTLID